MDEIKSMLDRLSELSEAEIADLESSILAEFGTVEKTVEKDGPSPEAVDTMNSLADALDTVKNEGSRREAAAAELAQRAAEASSRVRGEAEAGTKPAEEDGETVPDAETPAEDAAPAEAPVEDAAPAEAPVEDAAPAEDEDPEKKKPLFAAETPEVAEASTTETPAPEAPVTEASTETPDAAEAATEESTVTEASVEAPAEAEASAETPTEAEASTDAPAEAEASTEESASTTLSTENDQITEASTTDAPIANKEDAPMTASGTEGQDGVIEAPASNAPVPSESNPLTIVAGADVPGFSAGSTIPDMKGVAKAFDSRLQSLRRVTGGDGEQHTVASFALAYPEDRILTAGDLGDNGDKIRAVTSPEAIVAAGAICAPATSYYEVPGVGVIDRPVRDALAQFQADRGGIRYMTAPVLSSYISTTDPAATAVGVWDGPTGTRSVPPNGTAPAGVKPSLVVACSAEVAVYIDAITASLVFSNLQQRAHPEMIERHNELAMIAHARLAETQLLEGIKAQGTARTATQIGSATEKAGAAREFLIQVEYAAVRYRYLHRMGANETLRVIAPAWLKSAIRADLVLQAPGDGSDDTLGVTEGAIEAWLKARDVNITWSLESLTAFPSNSGTVGVLPATAEWDIFAEGSYLFLDGGTLDLGIIRDSALVGTNDYRQFVETFENVAKIGADSWHVTSSVLVSGAASALFDFTT